jgi:hypothetical protein
MMQPTGPDLTLGEMRAQGVRWVDVLCHCGCEDTIGVDALPDRLSVAGLRERLRCDRCGARPRQTRPHVGSSVFRKPIRPVRT